MFRPAARAWALGCCRTRSSTRRCASRMRRRSVAPTSRSPCRRNWCRRRGPRRGRRSRCWISPRTRSIRVQVSRGRRRPAVPMLSGIASRTATRPTARRFRGWTSAESERRFRSASTTRTWGRSRSGSTSRSTATRSTACGCAATASCRSRVRLHRSSTSRCRRRARTRRTCWPCSGTT